MSAIRLLGIKMPVKAGGLTEADDSARTAGRTVNGRMFVNITRAASAWDMTTVMVRQIEGEAIKHLLRPELNGHLWNAEENDLFSTKGLQTKNTTDIAAQAGGKFGSFELLVSSVGAEVIDLDANWTRAGWHHNGATWVHYLETSDGKIWEDGARNDGSSPPWATEIGAWILTDASSGTSGRYDELWYFPAAMPDTWPSQLDLTQALPTLPRLRATGSFLDEGRLSSVEIIGEGTSVDHKLASTAGAMESHYILSSKLRQYE